MRLRRRTASPQRATRIDRPSAYRLHLDWSLEPRLGPWRTSCAARESCRPTPALTACHTRPTLDIAPAPHPPLSPLSASHRDWPGSPTAFTHRLPALPSPKHAPHWRARPRAPRRGLRPSSSLPRRLTGPVSRTTARCTAATARNAVANARCEATTSRNVATTSLCAAAAARSVCVRRGERIVGLPLALVRDGAVRVGVLSPPFALAVDKVTLVDDATRVRVLGTPRLLARLELAFVDRAVGHDKPPSPVLLVRRERALVHEPSRRVTMRPLAVLLAVLECAAVHGAVGVLEHALAVPHAALVLALVLAARRERVLAPAMHRVVLPLPNVDVAVGPCVLPVPVLRAILPLALVHIAAAVVVGALAVHRLAAP
mmetsp:Transcript_9198/g.24484  ORF Transcript_9198/g.24484 Transcript_9198/m.24484 type:complete len:372 (-) Transcript_9198:1131-2246(-)